ITVLAATVIFTGFTAFAFAYPKPLPASNAWKLDFTFKKPEAISITNKKGATQWYWFMPYKVTNNTGKDQRFIPDVAVANSRGRIIHANTDIPAGLFGKIKKFLKNPLLKSPIQATGQIRQGKDFAIQTVAIWPADQKQVHSITLFVSGLSGETAVIKDPKTGKKIYLRRTRMIRLKLPGKHDNLQNQPVEIESATDIMR